MVDLKIAEKEYGLDAKAIGNLRRKEKKQTYHIRHGNNLFFVVRTPTTREDDIERPFGQGFIILGLFAENVHLFES